jgi:CDP-glycerol glycerophosphotransferase (TagB/SpsB family)
LPIVVLYGRTRRGGLRGGGLPCDKCQQFEFALSPAHELSGYYDITEFYQLDGLIYDFAFMDVDKILPFSSTLRDTLVPCSIVEWSYPGNLAPVRALPNHRHNGWKAVLISRQIAKLTP